MGSERVREFRTKLEFRACAAVLLDCSHFGSRLGLSRGTPHAIDSGQRNRKIGAARFDLVLRSELAGLHSRSKFQRREHERAHDSFMDDRRPGGESHADVDDPDAERRGISGNSDWLPSAGWIERRSSRMRMIPVGELRSTQKRLTGSWMIRLFLDGKLISTDTFEMRP